MDVRCCFSLSLFNVHTLPTSDFLLGDLSPISISPFGEHICALSRALRRRWCEKRKVLVEENNREK